MTLDEIFSKIWCLSPDKRDASRAYIFFKEGREIYYKCVADGIKKHYSFSNKNLEDEVKGVRGYTLEEWNTPAVIFKIREMDKRWKERNGHHS